MIKGNCTVYLALLLSLFVSCQKGYDCGCRENCLTNMQFQFDASSGYTAEETDTIILLSKYEGFRNYDTTVMALSGSYYTPSIGCPATNRLVLDKYKTDDKGKLMRVEKYKLYTAVDSFILDTLNVEVLRQDGKCECITSVERRFNLDGKKHIITQLDPPVILLKKK